MRRYAAGLRITGSELRARQSDQVGGTSIPDVCRALATYGFRPPWAAPMDGTPVPANYNGSYISPARLRGRYEAPPETV